MFEKKMLKKQKKGLCKPSWSVNMPVARAIVKYI